MQLTTFSLTSMDASGAWESVAAVHTTKCYNVY